MDQEKENGAALLVVLLLVAVMAALAAASFERLQLATRLAGNVVAVDQARAFATGAEALAIMRITDLRALDPGKTTLEGDWLGRESILPLPDGGVARARIWDGGNCFNLNSVVDGSQVGTFTLRPAGVEQFAALMVALEIPPGDARRIAENLGDWIDADTLKIAGGSEDSDYQDNEIPYRTANTLIVSPSELRAVRGMTPEYYAALRPWVCALPATGPTAINVNTLLPREAVLLAMLAPAQLNTGQAMRAIAARPTAGWDNVADFWSSPALAAIEPPDEAYEQVDVRTRWFRLELDVTVGDLELRQASLIDGRIVPGRVVARAWGRDD